MSVRNCSEYVFGLSKEAPFSIDEVQRRGRLVYLQFVLSASAINPRLKIGTAEERELSISVRKGCHLNFESGEFPRSSTGPRRGVRRRSTVPSPDEKCCSRALLRAKRSTVHGPLQRRRENDKDDGGYFCLHRKAERAPCLQYIRGFEPNHLRIHGARPR